MKTAAMVKVVLSCTGAAGGVGGACAIGIPALASNKSLLVDSSRPKIDLSKCDAGDAQNRQEVNHGSELDTALCWKLASDDSQDSDSFGEDYTNLLKEGWTIKERRGEDWYVGDAKSWTTMCVDDNKAQWLLPNTQDGPQYLGLCGNSKISEAKFIKKQRYLENEDYERQQEQDKSSKFWVCASDCWDTSSKQEKSDKWKAIKFYQKLNAVNVQETPEAKK